MGQTLSEPVKEKHSDSGSDDRLLFASSAMQGWRISMEDAHTAELILKDKKGFSFFGVYDGHGGQNIAKYSGAHLHERIARDPEFPNNIEDAIKNGFLGTDEDLRNDSQYANDPSGCTAVTSIITPENRVYVGNAGDSRAVISIDGIANPMSNDHKPVNKEESTRITKAGGFVEFGRVNGNLALSRAIDDFEFKQNPNLPPEEQIVAAYPDVKREDITEETEFLVLACDGIWDCFSSQQVASFISQDLCSLKIAKVFEFWSNTRVSPTIDTKLDQNATQPAMLEALEKLIYDPVKILGISAEHISFLKKQPWINIDIDSFIMPKHTHFLGIKTTLFVLGVLTWFIDATEASEQKSQKDNNVHHNMMACDNSAVVAAVINGACTIIASILGVLVSKWAAERRGRFMAVFD